MRFLFKSFLVISIIAFLALSLGYLYFSIDLPDVDSFNKDAKKTVEINFSNDEIITSFGKLYSLEVKFYELPQHLINAVIAIEDQKFFSHHGFDFVAIVRAAYVNHRAGRIKQGASTLTQQLAKLLFLSPERTFKRKIQEAILAFNLERKFTKEQIITMYLNHAYFGSGNYGVGSASRYYFNKDVSQLNLKESAMLAGLLKAPSKLSPKNDKELAEERAELVVMNMMKYGFVDFDEEMQNKHKDLVYKTNRLQRLYFADYVNQSFTEYLNQKDLAANKIIIKTTLNKALQQKLEHELNEFCDQNEQRLGKSEIAVVVMDKSGGILAMSGGKNYQKSQFNRAIYSKRQAGSAFKTFVYLAAFKEGFKPSDKIIDEKVEFSNWLPNNYDAQYFGEVSLKEAFAKSLNSVSIRLAQKIGVKKIARLANKLGILSEINDEDLTTALGTSEVSLLELTTAYASIANDSRPVITHGISQIQNGDGDVLYQRESSGFPAILSEEVVNYAHEILHEVVLNGTASHAVDQKNNIYGKTGTSQNYRDAWFIGFNDDLVIGVWIGNDDNSPTNKIVGGSLPAAFFARML